MTDKQNTTMEKFRRETFWHFINPVCLAIGVIGFLLHLELGYLEIGMTGIGAWSLTGIIGLEKEKKEKTI